MHSPSDLFSLGLSGQPCPHARCCDRLYAPVLDGFSQLPQPLSEKQQQQNCSLTLTAKSFIIFSCYIWLLLKRCLSAIFFYWWAPSFHFWCTKQRLLIHSLWFFLFVFWLLYPKLYRTEPWILTYSALFFWFFCKHFTFFFHTNYVLTIFYKKRYTEV